MTNEISKQLTQTAAVRLIERVIRSPVPTERDRAIYHQITVEGQPEEVVAGRLGWRIDTLRRCVRRVAWWMSLIDQPINTRHTLATHLARLEHQWTAAMAAWHRSCETEVVEKVTTETTPRKEKDEKPFSRRPEAGDTEICPATQDAHRRAACAAGQAAGAAHGPEAHATKKKTEHTTRRAGGDVRYLEQARKIMAEIRTLSAAADEIAAEAKKQAKENKEPVDVETLSLVERVTEFVQRYAQIREDLAGSEAVDE